MRAIPVAALCCFLFTLSACPKRPVPTSKPPVATKRQPRVADRSREDVLPPISSTPAGRRITPPREVLLEPSQSTLAESFAPSLGPPDAPVTITVFTDFACAACAQMVRPLRQILYAYQGKVRLVFKSYPRNHSHTIYAQAAMAAYKQGRFWAYHDLLFANHASLTRTSLLQYARQLGLNLSTFRKDMESPEVRAHLEADERQGQRKGLEHIPAFFLNQTKLTSVSGYAFLQKEINKVLRRKGYQQRDLPQGRPPAMFDLRFSPMLGDISAPVTLVAFLDFEDPMCALAVPQLRRLLQAFPGKVRLVYKHFPMRFQGRGLEAAMAAHAAYQQGQFWPYYQLLWEHQKKLQRADLENYARQRRLNLGRFQKALQHQTSRARVIADKKEGELAGVEGVPTLFINGYKATGFYFSTLQQQVLSELTRRGVRPVATRGSSGELFQTQHAPTLGPVNARVTVVIFSDFASSFSAMLAPSIRAMARTYQGKVRWVYKHFPESGNASAWLAAQAAMAAHAQGKFWAYHDLLFANTDKLQQQHLLQYARQLGLDLNRFQQAMQKKTYQAVIQRDKKEAKQHAVIGAPTLYVNGQRLSTANVKLLKRRIEQALRR